VPIRFAADAQTADVGAPLALFAPPLGGDGGLHGGVRGRATATGRRRRRAAVRRLEARGREQQDKQGDSGPADACVEPPEYRDLLQTALSPIAARRYGGWLTATHFYFELTDGGNAPIERRLLLGMKKLFLRGQELLAWGVTLNRRYDGATSSGTR
jgi:hypothetical protein